MVRAAPMRPVVPGDDQRGAGMPRQGATVSCQTSYQLGLIQRFVGRGHTRASLAGKHPEFQEDRPWAFASARSTRDVSMSIRSDLAGSWAVECHDCRGYDGRCIRTRSVREFAK